MTFLFSFFAEQAKLDVRLDSARKEVADRQFLHTRLQDLFISLDRGAVRSPLYTQLFPEEKQLSLIFIFDNGIDPDPAFSGRLLGRLFLDGEKNLSLAIWPTGHSEKWRKEILLSECSDFRFEFLASKKEDGKKGKTRPVNESVEWRSEIPKGTSDVPSLIRLSVWKTEKKPLQFAFILPSPEPIVTYWTKS